MRFFDEAVKIRFPRNKTEGALKFMMLAGCILPAYDLLYEPTDEKSFVHHSSKIIIGYLVMVTLGFSLGAVGERVFAPEPHRN